MLKKLFKQEWKSFSLAPTITMILLAVFTVILMTTFMTEFWDQSPNIFMEMFAGLVILAYIFCIAAVSFCVTLCTAVRFYKNFFTDEGYLMFTLPVKTSDLLLSKTFVAALWRFISIICICLSIFGIACVAAAYLSDIGIVQFFQEFFDLFRTAFNMEWLRDSLPIPVFLFFIWLALTGIFSLFFDILYIYTCICLGQLFKKHKIGGAILCYFGIRFIFRIFRQILTAPLSNAFLYYDTDKIGAGNWILIMFTTLLVLGGLCTGMYYLCNYLMSRQLNLE